MKTYLAPWICTFTAVHVALSCNTPYSGWLFCFVYRKSQFCFVVQRFVVQTKRNMGGCSGSPCNLRVHRTPPLFPSTSSQFNIHRRSSIVWRRPCIWGRCIKWAVIIIIIIYLSWSWATCWPVPVSRIQKSLQRSAMIPFASWRIVFHYPG